MLKIAIICVSTSFLAWYLERNEMAMIYPFDATYASPLEAGEPRLTETRFTTPDNEELIVWRAVARANRATILYFPGNAGGLKNRATRFSRLIDRGYGVIAVAYRGSSGSSGRPDEALLTADALALVRSETAHPLVLYGESLGTAIAIKLAAAGYGDALVLEAPFTSIEDLVKAQFPTESLAGLVTQKWDSGSAIGGITHPLLVIHGIHDRVVPFAMGQRLFFLAPSKDKSFLEIADRGHQGLWTTEMQRKLYAFLEAR